MNKYKKLRAFLIKRFIFTIIMISFAEYGLLRILRKTLIPFSMKYFFKGADQGEIRMEGFMILLVIVTGSFILNIIKMIIPAQIRFGVQQAIDFLNGRSDSAFVDYDASKVLSGLSRHDEALLLIVLFTIFIIAVTPYILGAIYYSRMVVLEVKIFEEEEKEKNKEFERRRNLMLSDIAHDLRTPMTTVSGYAMALNDGMVAEDKKQEYLSAIQTKTKRMSDLITLLFDYVKLDSDGFKLNKEKVDVCELVRECAAFQYQDIEDSGMELEVDIPEDKYEIVDDKVQFSRVITNLLTNAVRHNEPGTKIGLVVMSEYDEIRIMVADSGKLIPREEAEHIFEPFVMGDESRNSKGGTGLGLSIAKKIMDMHGFSIRLTQKPVINSYDKVKNYRKMFMITI